MDHKIVPTSKLLFYPSSFLRPGPTRPGRIPKRELKKWGKIPVRGITMKSRRSPWLIPMKRGLKKGILNGPGQ
jgi:hypothetical protein